MRSIPAVLVELADSLGMSPGGHGRRSRDGSFSRTEVARLLRIAQVLNVAQRLFGSRVRGLQWLTHRNRALRFDTPLSQLETAAGTKRVNALLDRIDGGAFP